MENWDTPALVRSVVVLMYLLLMWSCLARRDSTAWVLSCALAESGQWETIACLEASNCCCLRTWSCVWADLWSMVSSLPVCWSTRFFRV